MQRPDPKIVRWGILIALLVAWELEAAGEHGRRTPKRPKKPETNEEDKEKRRIEAIFSFCKVP